MKRMWDEFKARLAAWKSRRTVLMLRMTIKRGVALDKEGKSQDAIACFNEVLEADPKNAMAWSFKAGALLKMEKMHEAKEAYQNFVRHAGPEHENYAAEAKTIIRDIEAVIKKKKAR